MGSQRATWRFCVYTLHKALKHVLFTNLSLVDTGWSYWSLFPSWKTFLWLNLVWFWCKSSMCQQNFAIFFHLEVPTITLSPPHLIKPWEMDHCHQVSQFLGRNHVKTPMTISMDFRVWKWKKFREISLTPLKSSCSLCSCVRVSRPGQVITTASLAALTVWPPADGCCKLSAARCLRPWKALCEVCLGYMKLNMFSWRNDDTFDLLECELFSQFIWQTFK